ncbi:eukaryotic translation initiation factor 2-alpha kinase 1 isoform X1 [Bombus vancouverensis nearcticus]|uniref:non-specific serine/threonine protein kinase n=1 Tax=Bombus bifarius TaxID=103933 RepID=A0A6P8M2F5_9HYME|nr:eukaryotic translation initiation factor 2-alpha kinase 1-like isoform X1 [Bombus vancouverensis nearcticus]XP_033296910.1 eukaryotic translation initiation factor 2-alpha kinase 1-like isoform X1 [Bombus bifarius]
MVDNNSPPTNLWDTLSSATTFDRGNNANPTLCLDNESNLNNRQIVSIVRTSSSLLIASLIQQLCILFEDDSVRRNKLYFAICDRLHKLELIDDSYNMMEFEPLRNQYQQALYHLFTVTRAAAGCENSLQISSLCRPSMTEWSRYHREFQEISFIAAGGFGYVFKALHRLDGIEYAIKKITVRSDRVKNIMQHLEEVKTLAKLNHTNIVSYKGAWIEPMLPSRQHLVSLSHLQSKLGSIEHNKTNEYRSWINQTSSSRSQQNLDTGSSESPKENDKQDMLSQHSKWTNYNSEENVKKDEERTNSNSISFRNDSEHQNNKTENNTNYTDGSNSYEESSKNKMLLPYIPQTNKYTTLYIQMALCEKTLQQWLDERIEVTPQEMLIAILTQTLHGLDYIHSRGIVHHDIKPSNIFISTSGQLQIQLGDFGLACPLRSENHHSIIGTQMYAAPEQLQGKCDPKSDIYSLGIVLLELIVHTRTQMERIEIINSLKMGHIPTTLAATHLKWAHIVSQLVQDEPENRPSTNQLLQDLNEDKDMMIARLKIDIAKKDDVIQKLQERILILEEQMVKHSTSLQDI